MKTRSLAVALFCLFAWPASASDQPEAAFGDAALYEAVISQLFQHKAAPRLTEVQLRYTYCSSGEMQVALREVGQSQVELEIWDLPPGAPTIWNQLAKLISRGAPPDAASLASAITVRHAAHTIRRASGLGRLITTGRPRQVSLAGDDRLGLEGVVYGLTVTSLSRTVSITVTGSEEPSSSDGPLVQWMGAVRSRIARSAGVAQ